LVRAGAWTAYFDNSLGGTDAVSAVSYLSRAIECRALAVTAVPHTVGVAGTTNGRLGAVQFELFGPRMTEFLNYVRAISLVAEGNHWRFDTSGETQPYEEIELYQRPRKRDRFSSEILERYCRALGIDVFEPAYYGPETMLIESRSPLPPDGLVMTLDEAQRWFEIVPGMADAIDG
jgi:hypothetical protein